MPGQPRTRRPRRRSPSRPARPSWASTSSRSSGSATTLQRVRSAVLQAGPDAGRAALRPGPTGDVRRSLGGQGGGLEGARAGRAGHRLAGHRGRAAADRPAGGPPPRPRAARAEQLGWTGSHSRSPTSPTTRSRSRSGSGPPAADTSSRPTSRRAWTIASGGSWPAWSGCGTRTRPRRATVSPSRRAAGPRRA